MSNANPFPGSRPQTRQDARLHTQVIARTPIAGHGVRQRSTPNGTLLESIQRNSAGAGPSHPFKISYGQDPWSIKIAPGILYLSNQEVKPKIGNTFLDDEDPPTLPVSTGSFNVVLGFRVVPIFSSVQIGSPAFEVHFINGVQLDTGTIATITLVSVNTNPPNEANCVIDYLTGEAEAGVYYVSLGRVTRVGGSEPSLTVTSQYWRTNVSAALQGDGAMFYSIR